MTKVVVQQKTIDNVKENIGKYPDLDITIKWETAHKRGRNTVVDIHCNHCGNSRLGSISSLQKRKFLCTGCTGNRYKKLCEAVGWIYLQHKRKNKRNIVTAQCACCKNSSEFSSYMLTGHQKPACTNCQVNKYTKRADFLGYNYLGKQKIKGLYKIVLACKIDGEKTFVSISNFLNNNVLCKECQLRRYRTELAHKGCRLVKVIDGKVSANSPRKVVFTNKCGEVFTSAACGVLAGSFASSHETYWRNPHSVYLIKLIYEGTVYYKIGTSSTPINRLKYLQLIGNPIIAVLVTFENRFMADKEESRLHKEFEKFRIPRQIPEQFTEKIVKKKYKSGKTHVGKAGVTEWFVGEQVFQTLKIRYNLKEELNGTHGNPAN